jgi:hypothetical protein
MKKIKEPFVHEFGRAIQENKHLYTEEEFIELSSQWLVEYEKYLVDLVKKAKGG